jgi:hypothetical protein
MTPLLDGLNHAFSNRLLALSALIPDGEGMGRMTPSSSPSMVLGDEIERLDRLRRLYRLLSFADEELGEATLLVDLLPDLVALLSQHSKLRDIECLFDTAATPPLLLHPMALTQAVVVMVCAVARHLARGEEQLAVRIQSSGDENWVEVTVESLGPCSAEPNEEESDLAAVRWLIRHAEGSARIERTPRGSIRAAFRVGALRRLRRAGGALR